MNTKRNDEAKSRRRHHIVRVCPSCGLIYNEPPALSRKDNKTYICSMCGLFEALEPFMTHNGGKDNG